MADFTFDWRKLIGVLAPTIGTALGSPLAGIALSQLSNAIFGVPDKSQDDIAAAIAGGQLSGDQIAAIKKAEADFAVRMKELDIDVLKINQATELAYVADTSNAREVFSKDTGVFRLGVSILVGFAVLMGMVLTGCFLLMTGYFQVDPSVSAVCSGLIGTVIGYVAANAQQVTSYFFGSSKGSKDSGDRIGQALTETLKQAGSKP